jgi:hypothetical protein
MRKSKKYIDKNSYELAEVKMNLLLSIVTEKGGFDLLTEKEKLELEKYTHIVRVYESLNYII